MRRLLLAAVVLAAAALPAAAQDARRGAAFAEERGCGTCHGADGRSGTANIPSLAGQPAEFVTLQMILFREALRLAPPMNDLAKDLADGQIEDLAAYFAGLPPGRPDDRGSRDATLYGRGRALTAPLNCGVCHLPDYAGRNQIPRLTGQREDVLAQAMRQYRDSQRRGTDTNMNAVMHGVSDSDIAALAHFLAHQE